jgi:hypothetical protein
MVISLPFSRTCRADEPQARALVAKAIKAAGGEEKLARHRAATFTERGTYYGMGEGLPYTGKYAVQWPDQFRMEIEGVFTMVLNGDKGWMRANNETREMTAQELAQQREEHYQGWVATLLPLKDKMFTLDTIDEIKVSDRPAAGVKVSAEKHRDVKLYFDKETGLLVKSQTRTHSPEMDFKEVDQEVWYDAYVEFDGVKNAKKFLVHRDGKKFVEGETVEYKAMGKLDDSVFAKPE